MTSKNWFFKGMTEEIKRRLWAAALSAVIFFFRSSLNSVTSRWAYSSSQLG